MRIQRLIDGELNMEDVQQLLSTLGPESEQWKIIATGFVENQLLQSQFNLLDSPEPPRFENQSTLRPGSEKIPHSWIWSLAAAALMTMSIGVLIGANYFSNHGLQDNFPGVANSSSVLATAPTDHPPKNTPAVYRMQLQDKDGNQFIDTDIPFYQAANWNDVGQHKFKEYPADVRNEVLNSGYDFQQNTHYFQGRLNDGRRFVIPIRNTKFAPYQ